MSQQAEIAEIATLSNHWLIEKLEAVRATFENDTYKSLLSHKSLKKCYDLLLEKKTILEGQTKSKRSRRQRVRNIFMEVFRSVGSEVFVLCVLAAPITKLSETKLEDILADIQTWWNTAEHPQELTVAAERFCADNSISALIPPSRKRSLLQVTATTGKKASLVLNKLITDS
jgi:hypothetical protein